MSSSGYQRAAGAAGGPRAAPSRPPGVPRPKCAARADANPPALAAPARRRLAATFLGDPVVEVVDDFAVPVETQDARARERHESSVLLDDRPPLDRRSVARH